MDLAREIAARPGLAERLARLPTDPLPDTPILFAKVKLLWGCNLACEYCPPRDAGPPMAAARVRALLAALRARGLVKVHFSGGEPLLHPELEAILGEAVESGLQVNLTTNGTLLDGDWARRFARLGVHAVSVSLDAADPATHDAARGKAGAHKATVRALRALLRRGRKGAKVRVNTVVTRRNVGGLDALHEFLVALGPGIRWSLLPVDTPREALRLRPEDAAALLEGAGRWGLLDRRPYTGRPDPARHAAGRAERRLARGEHALGYYEDHRCYVPWLHLFVDPAGFAHPCCASRGSLPALGSLASGSVASVLDGEPRRALRLALAAGQPLDACRRCDDFIHENREIEALIASGKPARPGPKETP